MTLNQLSFFPSGNPSIANSRLLRPGDKRKTMTMGEEEEEKEDWTGGGVGLHSIARQQQSPPSPPRDIMPPVVDNVRCNNRKSNIVKHCYDRGVREH